MPSALLCGDDIVPFSTYSLSFKCSKYWPQFSFLPQVHSCHSTLLINTRTYTKNTHTHCTGIRIVEIVFACRAMPQWMYDSSSGSRNNNNSNHLTHRVYLPPPPHPHHRHRRIYLGNSNFSAQMSTFGWLSILYIIQYGAV